MASETVNAIFRAEKENAEKTADAKEKAAAVIAEAEAKAAAVTEKVIDDAKQRARRIIAEAEEKAAVIRGKTDEDDADGDIVTDKARYASAVAAIKSEVLE